MLSLRLLRLPLAAVLLLAGATTASAGDWPHSRDGLTAGVALGVGSSRAETKEADESNGAIAGGAGSLRVGYAVSPAVVISLEGIGWSNESYGVTQSFSIGGIGLAWFPGEGGLSVKGTVGRGRARYRTRIRGTVVEIDDTGSALGVGAGYEWRVARRVAIGPAIDGVVVGFDGGEAGWVSFTLGLNLYP